MQSFSWKYFTLTGDVDAYLLFRDIDRALYDREFEEETAEEEDTVDYGLS